MTDCMGDPIEIGILEYAGSAKSVIFGLVDMFDIANNECRALKDTSRRLFNVKVLELSSAASLAGIDAYRKHNLSVLIIPPTLTTLPDDDQVRDLSKLILDVHHTGTIVVSVCGGAYLLAASGIASGREMTTHWAHRDVLQRKYPDITVNTEQLLIDGGDIITAGGLMAWTDIGLLLVDRYLGTDVMISTSRFMILNTAARSQVVYSGFHPALTHGDAAVLKVQLWIHRHGGQGVNLPDMADQAGLNLRTFIRRFSSATGFNPGEYCQRFRISASRNFLMVPGCTIEHAAWQCGYGDVNAYRKVFKRYLGVTPSEYKSQFLMANTTDTLPT